MVDLLNKIIKTLHSQIESDFTSLIKFDQNKFIAIETHLNENIEMDFSTILSNSNHLDFTDVQNKLQTEYNLNSQIINNFTLGNYQYFLLSAFFIKEFVNIQSSKLHSFFSEIIKEIVKLTEENSKISDGDKNNFNLLVEASGELIFMLDKYGELIFINTFGYSRLKYSSEEIIGKHFLEIISDDSRLKVGEAFQKLISENNEISFNADLIPKVGIEQNYCIKLIPIFEKSRMEKLLGIGKDVSEINAEYKKAEEYKEKLKEANRLNEIERDRAKQQISILSELNDLKNEFISNVSHELRTPLASIIGFSETIIEDKNVTIDKAREFSEVIHLESKRLAKLINDVLDFSELENEKQQLIKNSLNVIELLNECAKDFESDCINKKIILTKNLPESEILIFADQVRIKKAINNLLSNAVKFTKENGRISIIAQEFLKEVEIIISDTGVGIAEQKIPLLFDKFSKVKRATENLPGAGFGLVSVKQIIDLHKGLIRVKSEVDKGTSFIIKLPKYSFN
jgi:PAS domain S-box-containing protein